MNIRKLFNIVMALIFAFTLMGAPALVSAQTPTPTIEALGTNKLGGYGWPLGLNVTITIDDPGNGAGVDYTVVQMPFEEPEYQGEGSLDVPIEGSFKLKPGYIIQASNGSITKTLVYSYLLVTKINTVTETISGVSDPGVNLHIQIHQSGGVYLDVIADSNGNWEAEFQGIYNLTPTTRGQVRCSDSDGDTTVQFFGNPVMYVYLIEDFVQGLNWTLGTSVTLTIDDPDNGPGVDYTDTQIVEAAWWNPDETDVGFLTETIGIRPDQLMIMTDGVTTITHIVTHLAVTNINPNADTVAGTADPESLIEVGRMCDENGCAFRRVNADADGYWLADFFVPGEDGDEQDLFDIRSGTQVKVIQKDDNENVETIFWSVPDNNQPQLTSLDPAKVWVGLKNSDDVGTKFDLLAEVYQNDILVGSGQLDKVNGGSSGFNNAKLNTIPLTLFAPVDWSPDLTLSIKLYVRNTCFGNTHNSGTARLWYNDASANSQFGATIDDASQNYFLKDGFTLSLTPGSGPRKTIDVAAGRPCSPFKLFGTWSIVP